MLHTGATTPQQTLPQAKHHNLLYPLPPPTQASMTMAKPVTSGIVIDDDGQADDIWHRHW